MSEESFQEEAREVLSRIFNGNKVSKEFSIDTEPFWKYGTSSGIGDDPFVQIIKSGSFADFMDNAPFHKNGLWYFVQKFGGRCGLSINLNKTRQKKYSEVKWQFR
jgi:hypothetical protein